VLYTSGSTGRPKGVQITHRSLTNFLQSMQREPGLCADDRVLSVTTLSFDIAGLELYLPLITGARLRLATRAEATDPARLADAIDTGAITLMQATPATWRMLLDHGWQGREDLTILCGGEAMVRDLANRLLTKARAVWNMYGPTETTIWSTIERVTPGDDPVSIGRPIDNTEAYVLDARRQPVPVGVPGELVIGGDGVSRGYLNRPDLTADRFVPDPFSGRPGARLYRTGDLARFRRDGRLECLGRLDQQVKVRGFRIELGEIESVLAGHERVTNAAVTLRRDRHGEPSLVGYVVLHPGEKALEDVRRHLRDRLPSYMVPSQLVEMDALPLTPNGKVDRAGLPPPPPPVPAAGTETGKASPAEQTIAGIWADVLGLPSVGLDDDFFNLGGHSLLAVRLMSRIERVFNKKIPLATLFEARTVRQLAEIVQERKARSTWVSLVPIQTEGSKPPLFCVHGVGGEVLTYSALASHLPTDQPFVAFRASGYDGASEPLETIEEQASLYVREMIEYQPEGPYYIGGYSHGGRVALEMAIQLEAMHKEVAFLGIFDTTPLPVRQPLPTYIGRWLRNVPLWFWYDGRKTSGRANLERLRRFRRAMWRRLFRSAPWPGRAGGARTQPRDIGDMMDVERLPDHIRLMYKLDFAAFLKYRPSSRCASATLFRSRGQPLFGSHEPDLGWSRVTRDGVDVRHIAGNHSSIMREPDVRHLAKELVAALEMAQTRAFQNAEQEREGDWAAREAC
jgi:thioesterase domain-containing protein/acyl carrier protein